MVETLYHYPYDLVVIDGIADLQRNTNDLEESDALVGALMALSTKTNTHILCVLHTNPGSDKARGHLGSALQRKAESVLYVHRNGGCSVVEPQFCRNEPLERFAFAVNDEGIPEICDIPQSESFSLNDRIVEILNTEYGGVVERMTLRNKIVEVLGLNADVARMRIKRLVDKGALEFDDNFVRSVENKRTTEQGVPLVQNVQNVRDVRDVRNVLDVRNVPDVPDVPNVLDVPNVTSVCAAAPVQSELGLDVERPRPQHYGHYDADLYENCPF